MKTRNVTLALERDLLEEARRYARKSNTSLNGLLRDLLRRAIRGAPRSDWADDFFNCCDEIQGDSGGKRWTRDELHER